MRKERTVMITPRTDLLLIVLAFVNFFRYARTISSPWLI